MTTALLSYARSPDDPFVKRLIQAIYVCRFDVWWNRVSLPSRLLTLHQKIQEAITAAGAGDLFTSDRVGPVWRLAPRGQHGRHADPASGGLSVRTV